MKPNIKEQLKEWDHWPIMEQLLGRKMRRGELIVSPTRNSDHRPSFGLYRKRDGQAYWNDFGGRGGDVYSLVIELHRGTYKKALETVASIAGLKGSASVIVPRLKSLPPEEVIPVTMSIVTRPWHRLDVDLWTGRFSLSIPFLEEQGVDPVRAFTIRKGDGITRTFKATSEDLAYCFKDQNGKLKIYRPNHLDARFKYMGNTNRNSVFGKPKLGKPLLIVSGPKDRLTSMYHLGLPASSFNSESVIPDDHVIYGLHAFTDGQPMIVLYDNDDAGRRSAKKVLRRYPFMKSIDLGDFTKLKDPSEMVEAREWKQLLALRRALDELIEASQ